MEVTRPVRKIMLEKDGKQEELADLNPDLPVADVVRMHATTNPMLGTAIIEGPTFDTHGAATYAVKTKIGHKG